MSTEAGVGSPQAAAADGWKPTHVGDANQTQVLWKSNMSSYHQAASLAPLLMLLWTKRNAKLHWWIFIL